MGGGGGRDRNGTGVQPGEKAYLAHAQVREREADSRGRSAVALRTGRCQRAFA